jgi:hypothetical protein
MLGSRLARALFRSRADAQPHNAGTMVDSLHGKDYDMGVIAEQEREVQREGLERFLERLIAERAGAGVRPEDVTEEYIRDARAKMRLTLGYASRYGGYNTTGLRVLTPDKEQEMRARFEKAQARALGADAAR